MTVVSPSSERFTYELPRDLEASEPPEARGVTRDAVRMLVAHRHDTSLVHATFSELPSFLQEGDLVVVNTSGTLSVTIGTGLGLSTVIGIVTVLAVTPDPRMRVRIVLLGLVGATVVALLLIAFTSIGSSLSICLRLNARI